MLVQFRIALFSGKRLVACTFHLNVAIHKERIS